MVPAPSEASVVEPGSSVVELDEATHLRVGAASEMADAVTRSHLADGRVVGWYGAAGVVIDAEIAAAPVPPALSARFGTDSFWERWTAAECGAKAYDVPIALWLREHGLSSARLEVSTFRWRDLMVSVGRGGVRHTAQPFPGGRAGRTLD